MSTNWDKEEDRDRPKMRVLTASSLFSLCRSTRSFSAETRFGDSPEGSRFLPFSSSHPPFQVGFQLKNVDFCVDCAAEVVVGWWREWQLVGCRWSGMFWCLLLVNGNGRMVWFDVNQTANLVYKFYYFSYWSVWLKIFHTLTGEKRR